jgi:hypothetical protein
MGDTTFQRGGMDTQEQRSTWSLFMGLTKWGALFVAVLVLFLVVWFCVGAGLGAAFVTALITTVLGVAFLGKKPAKH